MLLSDLPAAISATATALTDWTRVDPEPLSSREVHRWSRTYELTKATVTEVVELAVWDSATNGCVTLTYNKAGAETLFLVLTSPDQVLPALRLVGAVSTAVHAEAVLSA